MTKSWEVYSIHNTIPYKANCIDPPRGTAGGSVDYSFHINGNMRRKYKGNLIKVQLRY